MATQTNTCGTGANDASAGTIAWSNPGNITADDSSVADATDFTGGNTNYLKATNFGFALSAGSTISQIDFEFTRQDSTSGTSDSEIKMVIGGTVQTTNKSAGDSWSSTEELKTFSFTADLPTVAQLNASNFGVVISAGVGISTATQVDVVKCTVTFTTPTGHKNLLLMGVG